MERPPRRGSEASPPISCKPLVDFQTTTDGVVPDVYAVLVGMLLNGSSQSNEEEGSAILIAEDDENDISLIKRAFRQAGFDNPLLIARDGEQAIAQLRGETAPANAMASPSLALVLLDLKMPRQNGFEVLTWIREQQEFNHLPVVMLTASAETADVNRAYALGANSYMVKPASFVRLVDMINRLKEYCNFTNQNVGLTWI